MIKFRLLSQDFSKLDAEYEITTISSSNLSANLNLIEECINNFNEEIRWDGMFDIIEAQNRITNGMKMYIGLYDNKAFGYVWFNNYEDGRLLFNLFVRNNTAIRNYRGNEFVSNVIDKFETNKVIYCQVDEWNEKSIKLFKKLGFKEL